MDDIYKIILVDDEDEVRGRISSKISQESGFTVVGTAGNGYDALELIEKDIPSVVLTDIKMPFIDGVELAAIIKRDYPTVRVAFITGYDEFEYAREAIALSVCGYLTKPVTQEDISVFLQKLKKELDREYKENYNRELLQKSYKESLPLLMDNYFSSFLVAHSTDHAEQIERLRSNGVSLDGANYLLAYFQIEKDKPHTDILEYERGKYALRGLLEKTLKRYNFEFYTFRFSEGLYIVIIEKNLFFLKEIDKVFYEMVKLSEKFLNIQINIGVSNLHQSFQELRKAYSECSQALEYSEFLNRGRIVYINQLGETHPEKSEILLSDPEINLIEESIRFGSENDNRVMVEGLRKNPRFDGSTVADSRLFIINMVNILIRFSASLGLNLNKIAGADILEKMFDFHSMDQMFDWMISMILKLRESNLHAKMDNSQRLLDSAINLIKKDYADSLLSMERICDELGISVSYLSLLFRKHKNSTFIKELIQVRMEKAKELLMLTADKIVDIAEKCGYSEVYYFSHSFKKYTGVSPKKYREKSDA